MSPSGVRLLLSRRPPIRPEEWAGFRFGGHERFFEYRARRYRPIIWFGDRILRGSPDCGRRHCVGNGWSPNVARGCAEHGYS